MNTHHSRRGTPAGPGGRVLLLALLLVAAVGTRATSCPSAGCAVTVQPVCGSDLNTYINACVAACQGVAVAADGSCSADAAAAAGVTAASPGAAAAAQAVAAGGSSAASSFASRPGTISADAMRRYEDEGLVLVGTIGLADDFVPVQPQPRGRGRPVQGPVDTRYASGNVLKLTADGLVYRSKDPLAAAMSGRAPGAATLAVPGFDPRTPAAAAAEAGAVASAGRRRLTDVLGADTRSEFVSAPKYPWTSIGFIQTSGPLVANSICTGTLIGPNTVVTAAHCVVQDIAGRVMASSVRFAAGHYGGGTAPYGWANHVALYIVANYWTSPLVRLFDMAVIVLDRPVGRTAGTMGFMTAPSYVGPLQNGQYPGDKLPLGRYFWLNGSRNCSSIRLENKGQLMTHSCDTAPGASGSPLFQMRGRPAKPFIRAIHTYGTPWSNAGVYVTPFYVNFLSTYMNATA